LLQVITIGQAICDLAQHPQLKQQLILTTCKAGTTDMENELVKQVRQYDLRKKRNVLLHKAKGIKGLCISHDGGLVCCVAGKSLLVWSVKRSSLTKHTHRRTLTAIAAHPAEGCISTADCSGRIQLWYELDTEDANHEPRTATMHWHAHAVPALAFSVDGTFLVSGGEEMVLVVWQLATGQQQFLPRLGEAITSVATEATGTLYGCVCGDNAIRIVDAASMDLAQYIQGVYRASKQLSTGLLIEPRNGAAVFSGRAGTLQFFDYAQDKSVGELEVCVLSPVVVWLLFATLTLSLFLSLPPRSNRWRPKTSSPGPTSSRSRTSTWSTLRSAREVIMLLRWRRGTQWARGGRSTRGGRYSNFGLTKRGKAGTCLTPGPTPPTGAPSRP